MISHYHMLDDHLVKQVALFTFCGVIECLLFYKHFVMLKDEAVYPMVVPFIWFFSMIASVTTAVSIGLFKVIIPWNYKIGATLLIFISGSTHVVYTDILALAQLFLCFPLANLWADEHRVEKELNIELVAARQYVSPHPVQLTVLTDLDQIDIDRVA